VAVLCFRFMGDVPRGGPHDSGGAGRGPLGCVAHRAGAKNPPFHRSVGSGGRPASGRRYRLAEAQASGNRNGAQHDLGGRFYRRMAPSELDSGPLRPMDPVDVSDCRHRAVRLRSGDVYRVPSGGRPPGRTDAGPVGADGLVDQPHPDDHGGDGDGDRLDAGRPAIRRNLSFFRFDWTRDACFDTILGEAFEVCRGKRC
jgi:hypothetical protein